MTIKTFSSGADNSLGLVRDIRGEFGGTPGFAQDGRIKPVQISQYYRGGSYVPNLPSLTQNNTIPTSGLVKFSNYYGTKTPTAPPQYTFTNGSFESGLVGWTALNQSICLNGASTILGWPTPTDPTPAPYGGPGNYFTGGGQAVSVSTAAEYQAPNGGTHSILLQTGRHVGPAGGIIYGPALYSDAPIDAGAGTKVTFQWRGVNGADAAGGDAYSVFGYMLNPLTGRSIIILNDTSPNMSNPTTWQTGTKTFVAGEEGIYHFVFICGSFDATFGTVVGAALVLDNLIVDNNVLLS